MLEQIHSPADLKGLSPEELTDLAQEIREFVVAAVDEAGSGHLGSNLGVVELTLALHRVFDSPRRHHPVGHRPPGVRPQDRSPDARADFRDAAPGRRPLGLPVPGRVRRTTGSRTATPRPSCRYAHGLAAAQEQRAGRGAAGHRRDRRRLDDRRHGVRGPQQPRPHAAARRSSSSTTTGARTPRRSPAWARAWPASASTRPTCASRPASSAPSSASPPANGWTGASRPPRPPSARCGSRPPSSSTLGVRYTGPFDGHDIEGLEQALRNAAELRRPGGRPRPHPEGPGLRPGRERPDQAPARHRRREAGVVHRGLHRSPHQGGRGAPRAGGHHRRHARLDRAAPLRRALPRPLLRRRHRRAARRHRRPRAWPWAGSAPSSPSTPRSSPGPSTRSIYDVGLHRQPVVFCLDRAGITGDDGPSHHGVLDMVAADQGAGHDDLRPVVVPGAAASCSTTPWSCAPTARRPSAGPRRRPPASAPSEVGSGLHARQVRARHRRLHHRRRQDARPPPPRRPRSLEADGRRP